MRRQFAVMERTVRKSRFQTDVTPAILSHDLDVQFYHATKLQYATVHVAHHNSVA